MEIVERISEVREIIAEKKKQGLSVALVPTMGYLHQGHLSLVKQAKQEGTFVVMSIFVNPLQFGPNEDLSRYPRDLEHDAKLAREAGVDLIFHPSVEEMYPQQNRTTVQVSELGNALCGLSRPGHFNGVTTVVSKLFHIVQPNRAYFGQKDYQQYLIVRQMVRDLNFPLEVISVPIVREEDGLALSSRNIFLSPEQRQEAVVLSQSLAEAETLIHQGEHRVERIEEIIQRRIAEKSSGIVDYIEVRSAENLEKPEVINESVVIALAVKFGTTRLIDNRVVEV